MYVGSFVLFIFFFFLGFLRYAYVHLCTYIFLFNYLFILWNKENISNRKMVIFNDLILTTYVPDRHQGKIIQIRKIKYKKYLQYKYQFRYIYFYTITYYIENSLFTYVKIFLHDISM